MIYNSFYVPEVWEKTPYGGERTTSLLGKLLKERIILLGTPIDEHVANLIMAQLLHLESEDPDKDISLYINSPGGEITGLFAIYDTMQFIKPLGADDLHRPGRVGRRGDPRGGRARQAVHPPARPGAHPPAARWCAGPGRGHPDPGEGDHAHA